jgi:hypothetical protein
VNNLTAKLSAVLTNTLWAVLFKSDLHIPYLEIKGIKIINDGGCGGGVGHTMTSYNEKT